VPYVGCHLGPGAIENVASMGVDLPQDSDNVRFIPYGEALAERLERSRVVHGPKHRQLDALHEVLDEPLVQKRTQLVRSLIARDGNLRARQRPILQSHGYLLIWSTGSPRKRHNS